MLQQLNVTPGILQHSDMTQGITQQPNTQGIVQCANGTQGIPINWQPSATQGLMDHSQVTREIQQSNTTQLHLNATQRTPQHQHDQSTTQEMGKQPHSTRGIPYNPNPTQGIVQGPNSTQGVPRQPTTSQEIVQDPDTTQGIVQHSNVQEILQIKNASQLNHTMWGTADPVGPSALERSFHEGMLDTGGSFLQLLGETETVSKTTNACCCQQLRLLLQDKNVQQFLHLLIQQGKQCSSEGAMPCSQHGQEHATKDTNPPTACPDSPSKNTRSKVKFLPSFTEYKFPITIHDAILLWLA